MTNSYFRLIEVIDDVIIRTIGEYDTFEEAKADLYDNVDSYLSSLYVDVRDNVIKEYYRDTEHYSCTLSYMKHNPKHIEKREYIVTVL